METKLLKRTPQLCQHCGVLGSVWLLSVVFAEQIKTTSVAPHSFIQEFHACSPFFMFYGLFFFHKCSFCLFFHNCCFATVKEKD